MANEVVRVFCLDVGQGDATVVIGPQQDSAILVDAHRAGPVVDVLREQGVKRLRLALLTHADTDHSAGFASVLEEFIEGMSGRVDFVAFDLDRCDAERVCKRLLVRLCQLACPEGRLGPRRFEFCPHTLDHSVTLRALRRTGIARIVYPKFDDLNYARAKGMPNDASAVVMLEWREQRMLLGGDLGSVGWSVLAKRMPDGLWAHVFRFPHHGGRFIPTGVNGDSISQEALLDRIRPAAVVISVGTNNRHGHPDPGTIRAIRSRKGVRLLCTEATRLCLCKEQQKSTADPQGPTACAGDVLVTLGARPTPVVVPSEPMHTRTVDGLANPLCRER